jgi:hypothetical protein
LNGHVAQAKVLVDTTDATPETKKQAREALEGVKLCRGTNIAAGLLLALTQQVAAATADTELPDSPSSQKSHRRMHAVLLCTDGHPTVGLRTRADILKAQQEVLHPGTARPAKHQNQRVLFPEYTHCIPVSQWPAAKPTVRIVWPTQNEWRQRDPSATNKPFVKVICFGLGEDHNPYLLGDIASSSGGSYFFVRTSHDVAPAVTDSLGVTLPCLLLLCTDTLLRSYALQSLSITTTPCCFSLQRHVREAFIPLTLCFQRIIKRSEFW